jgi:hypothetical protein
VRTPQGETYPTNELELFPSTRTVAAYLSSPTGELVVAGLGEVMFDDPFDLAVGFVPSTNAMTAHGLPAEKVNTFNLAENNGPTDGVSQTATSPPTSVLVTLAAAGRNPTDILIPTQAGSEGPGGDDDEDDDVAGGGSATSGGTFQAMDDPPIKGSNVVSAALLESWRKEGLDGSPQSPKLYRPGGAGLMDMLADDIRANGGQVPETAKPVEQPQTVGTAFDGVDTVEVAWPQTTWIPGRGPLAGQMVLVTPPADHVTNVACASVGLLGNGLELAGAIGLAMAPEGVGTKVGALVLFGLAIDGAQANARTIFSFGDPTPTFLNQVVTNATGNEYIGAGADFLAHTGGSIVAVRQIPRLSSGLSVAGPGTDGAPLSTVAAEGLAPNSIGTPHGTAVQSLTPEALALRQSVADGQQVFRGGNFPKSAGPEGQYWSPQNPLNPGYADSIGAANLGTKPPDFILGGIVRPGANFITRAAPPFGRNAGGALEVVPESGGVQTEFFHMP